MPPIGITQRGRPDARLPAADRRSPAGTPRRSAAPSRSPSRSRRPSRDRRGPHAGAAGPRAASPRAGRAAAPSAVALVEDEAGPLARRVGLVDDRVGEAAGPPDDRRRPVAQRDHLALAARLEARRHEEAGPRRRRSGGPWPDRTARRARRGPGARRPAPGTASARPASPLPRTMIRAPRASERRRGVGAARSKPFCGSSRPIIPRTGAGSAGSKPTRVRRSARQAALPAGRRPRSTAPRGRRPSPGPRASCRGR